MALRVGVIGAGWVAGARHLPAYRHHPETDVVAVLDRRRDRAEATSRRLGVGTVCTDLDQFLAQRLDLVSVCTPPWSHAELAVACLEAGMHVLCEKPMAMSEPEAAAMAEAAGRAGRLLCISHNFLFSRAVGQADRARRALGAVLHATGVQLSSPHRRLPTWYPELPGGLLFDELPHLLYVLRHFLGPLELEGVRATKADRTTLPATCEIQLAGAHANALVVTMFASPVSEWHVGLVAERGVVDVDLFREFAVRLPPDGDHGAVDILRTSAYALGGHVRGFAGSGAALATRRLSWGHTELVHRFVDAVQGRCPSPVDVEDAVAVVRLTDAVLSELGAR